QLRLLNSLGWNTPRVAERFDATSASLGPEKMVSPRPDTARKSLLVVTAKRASTLSADGHPIPRDEDLDGPLDATRVWLRHNQVGGVTIPVSIVEGVPYAYGMAPERPESVDRDTLDALTDDLIF